MLNSAELHTGLRRVALFAREEKVKTFQKYGKYALLIYRIRALNATSSLFLFHEARARRREREGEREKERERAREDQSG